MQDDYQRKTARAAERYKAAFLGCIEDGMSAEEAASALLEFSCGGVKGAMGAAPASKVILKVRDDIWAELTLAAERCR